MRFDLNESGRQGRAGEGGRGMSERNGKAMPFHAEGPKKEDEEVGEKKTKRMFNPFTVPACKISGLKNARTHMYFPVL